MNLHHLTTLATALSLQLACGSAEIPSSPAGAPLKEVDVEFMAVGEGEGEGEGGGGSGGEGEDVFIPGLTDGERPARSTLRALPGGGVGGPVLTSNNPEVVSGRGLLYGNARPLLTRGGQPVRLEGRFGVYLHHLVDTANGSPLFISLLITNPNPNPVHVDVQGSGYSQTETGGLAIGQSPDYRVSRDVILGTPDVVHSGVEIPSGRPFLVWQRLANDRVEVDGRFAIQSDAPVFVYVVATETADINDAVRSVLVDAPGDYRISGNPAPPFGREAGVYANDTWLGTVDISVPSGPAHVGYMVNTATGLGFPQVQAFPAIAHLDGSAREAVGMYGNVYDLEIVLRHDGGAGKRRVRVWFTSLATANISRYWDGVGLVNDAPVDVQHVPTSPSTLLSTIDLLRGEVRTIHFKAMVPGLASIPQALVVETLPLDNGR